MHFWGQNLSKSWNWVIASCCLHWEAVGWETKILTKNTNRKHPSPWHDSWPAYYLMASRRPEFTRHLLVVIQNHWISDQWAVIQQNWWCCRPWCRIPTVWGRLVSFLCKWVGGSFFWWPFMASLSKFMWVMSGFNKLCEFKDFFLESTTKALKPRMILYHWPFIDQINGGWLWADFKLQPPNAADFYLLYRDL